MENQTQAESVEAVIGHSVDVPVAPRMAHMWPEAHEAIFRQLYDGNMSFSLIAIKLNELCGTDYTRNACIAKSHRMNLPPRGPRVSNTAAVRRIRRTARQKTGARADMAKIAADRELAKRLRRKRGSIGPNLEGLRAAVAEPSLNLDILSLTDATCHYPYGDGPFTFCGHQTHEKSCYCAAHLALCYQPTVKSGSSGDRSNNSGVSENAALDSAEAA